VDALYASIITAGTYKAESIRVAEAAKVIENTQRDLNIALINELAIIFNRMGIDGVDPYYLTHKAEAMGYYPQVILAGRRINDGMGAYIAGQLIKEMLRRGIMVRDARVLVLGLTFKENCPDLRNTRVIDVIAELDDYGITVDVHDPWADPAQAQAAYGITLKETLDDGVYDGILLAVAHDQFREGGTEALHHLGKPEHVLYDLKYLLDADASDLRL